LQNNYRYRMLAFSEWRELYRAGKLNQEQRQFFERRPAEQLFDLDSDPHEVKDLSGAPEHRDTLVKMRVALRQKVKRIHDLSFYPESHMAAEALGDGAAYGRRHAKEINGLVTVADLALVPFAKASKLLADALVSENPWERYWACISCGVHGEAAKSLIPAAKKLLTDENLMVRVRAAEFLGTIKAMDPMPTLVGVLNESESSQEVLLTFNTITYLRDHKGYAFDLTPVKLKVRKGEYTRRTDYLSRKGKP
ncbi:MAG: HEAT repeat domain-containing protein, partial [Opitutales bacterium]